MSKRHSSSVQRTTIRLDEHLFIRVKEYAIERRRSFTSVVTEALSAHLASDQHKAGSAQRARVRLPVSKQKGGFAPGIKDWEDVKRVLEEQEIENFQRMTREDAARRR
ncbi:hypothetical protein BH18VER1_BH18VER1_21150 [soil metagenome]